MNISDCRETDRSAPNTFVEKASGRLAGVRNGILIFDQDHSVSVDLDGTLSSLKTFRSDAAGAGRIDLLGLIDCCEREIRTLIGSGPSPAAIGRSLDAVARAEEA